MAQIRIGHSLSDGEKKYIAGRKSSVHQCLAKNNILCTLDEVPNIAFLGSGGGERAMVGLLGSLYQLGKQELLGTALYLSGVSGSTWCMASVYEKPGWSLDIQQLKKGVAERLAHGSISLQARIKLLLKYYQNVNFSLTDAWAALVVSDFVHKIDESTLSNYQSHEKDPYPIYTMINQDSKYKNLINDTFFELTPHEAGYSTAGAFVETSSFGSEFHKGKLIKQMPEMDMTYLQGVCGSALADKKVILKTLKDWLENGENLKAVKEKEGHHFLTTLVDLHLCLASSGDYTSLVQDVNNLLSGKMLLQGQLVQLLVQGPTDGSIFDQIYTLTAEVCQSFFDWYKDLEIEELIVFVKTLEKVNEKPPNEQVEGLPLFGASNGSNEVGKLEEMIDIVKTEAGKMGTHEGPRLIHQMLELTHRIIRGEEWAHLVEDLNELLKGKQNLRGEDLRIIKDEWHSAEPQSRKKLALTHTSDVCRSYFSWFGNMTSAAWHYTVKKIVNIVERMLNYCSIWGTTYNYLFSMKDTEINKLLLAEPIQHFEDAGLLNNSPYISALRSERKMDLIISFDFSEGDPMETVTNIGAICKKLDIPFPVVEVTNEDRVTPKSFYEFKGSHDAPTVIHMPLFNSDNCGDELSQYRKKYKTFQATAYSPEMIDDLMEKSGENIINNKAKILEVIESVVKQKRAAASAV